MTIDIKCAELIDSAGRQITERGIKEISKAQRHIDTILGSYAKITGRDINKYSIAFTLRDIEPPSLLTFNFPKVQRASLRNGETLNILTPAVNFTDNNVNINSKYLSPNTIYLLDIECLITDQKFLKSLINKDVAADIPTSNNEEGIKEYWLNAELKHPSALKEQQGAHLNLRDLDIDVDVSIGQDIKMTIPGALRAQMEARAQLGKPMGRSEAFKANLRYQVLSRGKYAGKHDEILQHLQDIFTESHFKKYIEVLNDFRYNRSFRGIDYYDKLPIKTWPRNMNVISRTDLSVDKPAAEGILKYKRRDFMEDIEKKIGI
jgi:hypothetical protein